MNIDEQIKKNRYYMQCPSFDTVMRESDQKKGLLRPEQGKDCGGQKIVLPAFDAAIKNGSYTDLLTTRRSIREYCPEKPMSQEQLAFLLWSINSVQQHRDPAKVHTLRPVPSGGARHPFEVYFVAKNIEGLEQGLYHYMPMENIGEKLVTIERLGDFDKQDYNAKITEMLSGQDWAVDAAMVAFISCIPYRGEWRYMDLAHRVMLTDLGFLSQNFMLSCAAMNLGSCCMAGYRQGLCDEVFGHDGLNEYTVMAIAAGVPKEEE